MCQDLCVKTTAVWQRYTQMIFALSEKVRWRWMSSKFSLKETAFMKSKRKSISLKKSSFQIKKTKTQLPVLSLRRYKIRCWLTNIYMLLSVPVTASLHQKLSFIPKAHSKPKMSIYKHMKLICSLTIWLSTPTLLQLAHVLRQQWDIRQ